MGCLAAKERLLQFPTKASEALPFGEPSCKGDFSGSVGEIPLQLALHCIMLHWSACMNQPSVPRTRSWRSRRCIGSHLQLGWVEVRVRVRVRVKG